MKKKIEINIKVVPYKYKLRRIKITWNKRSNITYKSMYQFKTVSPNKDHIFKMNVA